MTGEGVVPGLSARDMVHLLRPQQWIKNLFVLAPLLMTPDRVDGGTLATALAAFVVFCLLSSAGYLVNDVKDRDTDRLHPRKRLRPLARGAVTSTAAVLLAVLLAGAGLGLAAWLGRPFALWGAGYLILTMSYSLALKHVSILDVLLVASGFVLRVEAGAAAVGIVPTVWIVVCTWLLALFLALAKRRDDLVIEVDRQHRRSLDGYTVPFLDVAIGVVLSALLVSYALYTASPEVQARLGTARLYLTLPFVAAGALRYLQITLIEERSGDPTALALTDRFLGGAILGWAAALGALIYE